MENELLQNVDETTEVSTEIDNNEEQNGSSMGTLALIGGIGVLGGVLLHKYLISPIMENRRNRKASSSDENDQFVVDVEAEEMFEEDSEKESK